MVAVSKPSPSVKSQPGPTRQRVQNWSHSEIVALILCKQKEYATHRGVVDPRGRMVPATQKWQKISEELQAITHSKVARVPKMCKDKWNGLNGDYKKVSDYHKGTGHYTSFWDLTLEEKDKLQLPRQFHSEFYDAIEAFQGERVLVSNSMHTRDTQVEDSAPVQSQVIEGNINASNLDDNLDCNSQFNSQNIVINLSDTPAALSSNPLPVIQQRPAIGVPGPGNTLVKRKRNSAFLLVIEATDKSSRVSVEAMDRLNATQQDLEKMRTKQHKKFSKSHLEYMQQRDKKNLKMSKNMVSVLSNLSTAMCHAFIKDPTLIPTPVNLSQSSSEGQPTVHCLHSSDEE